MCNNIYLQCQFCNLILLACCLLEFWQKEKQVQESGLNITELTGFLWVRSDQGMTQEVKTQRFLSKTLASYHL